MKARTGGRRGLFIDIGYSSLKVLEGGPDSGRGLELPLERSANGELTSESAEAVVRELGRFLGGQRRARPAFCALPARGVSLRRSSLPPASREETVRLLALEVEREFPLPPEKLAWGYRLGTSPDGLPQEGAAPAQEATIAALRREVLDGYASLLERSGLRPTFSLGALAASTICPPAPGIGAVLDIGRTHSELLIFEDGKASSVRSLSWGGEAVTAAISRALGVAAVEAEEVKRNWGGGPALEDAEAPVGDERVHSAIRESLAPLVELLRQAFTVGPSRGTNEGTNDSHGKESSSGPRPPGRLYLTGGGSRLRGLPAELSRGLGVSCEVVDVKRAPGCSAVTLGLREQGLAAQLNGSVELLSLERALEGTPGRHLTSGRLWMALAVVLVLLSLSFRYAVPAIRLPGLERRLVEARAALGALPRVDWELGFLESLEAARAPYLEVLAAIARSAPPGTFLESFSMNQRGEVSLRGTMSSVTHPNEFREKLTASGWFEKVMVEEQRQKDENRVEFRMAARLRGAQSWPPATPADAPEGTAPSPPPTPPASPPEGKAPERKGAPASTAATVPEKRE